MAMGFVLRKIGFGLFVVVVMVVPQTTAILLFLSWWIWRGLTADQRLKDGNEVRV
jgi:hypothetical protein